MYFFEFQYAYNIHVMYLRIEVLFTISHHSPKTTPSNSCPNSCPNSPPSNSSRWHCCISNNNSTGSVDWVDLKCWWAYRTGAPKVWTSFSIHFAWQCATDCSRARHACWTLLAAAASNHSRTLLLLTFSILGSDCGGRVRTVVFAWSRWWGNQWVCPVFVLRPLRLGRWRWHCWWGNHHDGTLFFWVAAVVVVVVAVA